ncbi:secretory carrier-associated membrane protein 2 isoform X1 [Heterocephalus glaber]|uniref:Secretory carrier-associated membrane protein n=1 Tax=Heterocephalus glaber TaxID=10181 RepID=A0AAX6QFQ4_HETGA|nr:secretory carrier-associated membrane protein 2 isoform X1 [Heterocephalus glaber]
MSAFDSNPFADPVDVNPFQDPSVTQLTNHPQSGLAEFNPFSETNAATTVPTTQLTGPSQPAVLQPSVEPTQPSPQAVAAAAQAGLLRQQEELDRKAAELERKERELQSTAASLHVRENNWPPLPTWCPLKPCFYQDFSTEIPADYQRICKMLYYLWMLHSVTLFLNLLACLAWFTVDTTKGVDFGLSILWFVIFTPCAFLCWYRPIYKAFRGLLHPADWLAEPGDQWLDCSPVHNQVRVLGCVHHHDGGGWFLLSMCWAVAVPLTAGALFLPPDRSQLPAGPGRVFPGYLQQQDLPKCCLLRCPGSLPGQLAWLQPLSSLFCTCPELHFPWCLIRWGCPAQTWWGSCLGSSSFLSNQLSLPLREGEEGIGILFLHMTKEK